MSISMNVHNVGKVKMTKPYRLEHVQDIAWTRDIVLTTYNNQDEAEQVFRIAIYGNCEEDILLRSQDESVTIDV